MASVKISRRRRKEDRPSEIIQAALEIFSANGFAATRLDDVAARAGITKGTIYVYFGSKEELFVATLKEKTRPVFDHLVSLTADPQGPALDILRRHLRFVAAHMIEDPCGRDLLRIMLAEGHRFPDAVDRWYAEVLEPALQAVGRILQYGVARGEFRVTDVQRFPQLVMAPVILCNTWHGLFGDRLPLDINRFFETALDLLAGGLAKPEPTLAP